MKRKVWQLDYACEIGTRVWWGNIKGERWEGTLLKMQDSIATVRLDDGTTKEIEC